MGHRMEFYRRFCAVLPKWWTATEVMLVIANVVTNAIANLRPDLGESMGELGWAVPLGLLVVFTVLGLLLIPPKVYADLKKEKQREIDELKTQLAAARGATTEQIFCIDIVAHHVGEYGPSEIGMPKGKPSSLWLKIHFNALSKTLMESLQLDVAGQRTPAVGAWSREMLGAEDGWVQFLIPADVTQGDHEIRILAFGRGHEWQSGWYRLTLGVER